MNKILIVLFICCSFNAQSKYWNQMFSESDELKFFFELTLLPNDRLVFIARSENLPGLFSFDIQSNQLTQIFTADTNGSLNNMIQLGDALYFLSRRNEESYFRLWKTDGTMPGTSQVSDVKFNNLGNERALSAYDNSLFGLSNDGAILEFDGEELTAHNIQSYRPLLSDMCVFGQQNFIIADLSGDTQVFRINGSITTDLTSLFPQDFIIQSFEGIDSDCYINFSEGDEDSSPLGILKISQSGEIKLFRENEGEINTLQVFQHNNQRFALINENNTNTLVKLAEDDSVIENILSLGVGRFTEYASTTSLLYLNFRNQTILRNELYTVDSELLAERIQTGTRLKLPQFKPSLDADISVDRPLNRRNADNFDINILSHNGLESTFKSSGFDHLDSITSKTTNDKYFFLRNRETGLKSVFGLVDQPKIDTLLNGIWDDPELQNQGLFIKQGNRFNGSKYILATIYTYRDEKPLWLAGVKDFTANQDSIEINLTDYRGTGFLELVEEPIQTAFGKVQIELMNCDQLQATVLHNNQTFKLNLNRIDNTTFKKYCLEQIDP